jgi:hypothetical protein
MPEEGCSESGYELFESVCKFGLEGIVSKKLDALIGRENRKPGPKSKIPRRLPQLSEESIVDGTR